jgi:hypothetical protein
MDLHEMAGGRPGDAQELPGLDSLYTATVEGRPSDELEDLRAVLCRLPMLGPYNAMLVEVQRPGSLYVATAPAWHQDFGRRLRPGARPLVILKPFGPVEFVYDVSDTEGSALPADVLSPFRVRGPITEEGLVRFADRLRTRAIGYRQTADPQAPGRTERVGTWDPSRPASKGEIRYTITVDEALNPAARLATVFHELGHIYCDHLQGPTATQRHQYRQLSERRREFEADIVSWLACGRLRIDSAAGRDLRGYAEADGSMPPVSVQAIVHALGKVEAIGGGLRSLAAMVSGPPASAAEEAESQDMLDFDPGP